MCFDGRKPEAAPLMRAAAERALPEYSHSGSDALYAAAALLERLREQLLEQGRTIERLKAEVDRLDARLAECRRGRRGGRDE